MSNEHTTFTSTKTGCAQRELYQLFAIFIAGLFIRNVGLPWISLGKRFDTNRFSYWLKFLIDVVFLIGPSLAAVTIFANKLGVFLIVLVIFAALILFFVVFEAKNSAFGPPMQNVWNRIIDEQYRPTMFVTYLRSATMIFVTIAILAVDFPIFPRRYAKTINFGHSLMDIGVAAFIYISAVGSRMATASASGIRKKTRKWVLSSTSILFILGFLRVVVLEIINYPKHVTEYGVHWNFFFTMAVVRIAYSTLPKTFPQITAILMGICHHTVLKAGYQDWIIDEGRNKRDDLISANAEGIFSLLGYLTIFYASLAIGEFLAKTCLRIKSWIRRCFQLLFLSFIFWFCQFLCELMLDPPSRRVVNLAYIFSQLSLMVFGTAISLIVQMFHIYAWSAGAPQFSNGEDPFSIINPCLTEAINKHALLYFMVSNVLTGIVNMSIDAHNASNQIAILILCGYMLVTALFVQILVHRKFVFKIHSE